MPNIDSLIETISQTLSNAPQETACFRTLDLQYAYSQLNLHTNTAHHCNFIFCQRRYDRHLSFQNKLLRAKGYAGRI